MASMLQNERPDPMYGRGQHQEIRNVDKKE
jgi:hypothetical protein